MADNRNYADGFYHFFDWKFEIIPGITFPVEIAAWIAPDESVGNTDWYVARLELAETGQEITKDIPLAITMSAHVSREHDGAINIRWREWLADTPRKRASAGRFVSR
jgi:hypothetical protein